ncbi:hypothetical protein CEE36_06820 [candidate division TA06 bacterium B3_TA06]|uniref:Uncharacterized protein n=1 Tax=candidate division TA06 bacterium B3_TA06 TaxID=2012487 RepID=A0A532V6G5_UNCT6|nr:MAG: hypothetical protein CEE36_06820 [candidate division TA06 bacterium B3_TA06]
MKRTIVLTLIGIIGLGMLASPLLAQYQEQPQPSLSSSFDAASSILRFIPIIIGWFLLMFALTLFLIGLRLDQTTKGGWTVALLPLWGSFLVVGLLMFIGSILRIGG